MKKVVGNFIYIGVSMGLCFFNYYCDSKVSELARAQDIADKSESSKDRSAENYEKLKNQKLALEAKKDSTDRTSHAAESKLNILLNNYDSTKIINNAYSNAFGTEEGVKMCLDILGGTKIENEDGKIYSLIDIVRAIYQIKYISNAMAMNIAHSIRSSGIVMVIDLSISINDSQCTHQVNLNSDYNTLIIKDLSENASLKKILANDKVGKYLYLETKCSVFFGKIENGLLSDTLTISNLYGKCSNKNVDSTKEIEKQYFTTGQKEEVSGSGLFG